MHIGQRCIVSNLSKALEGLRVLKDEPMDEMSAVALKVALSVVEGAIGIVKRLEIQGDNNGNDAERTTTQG